MAAAGDPTQRAVQNYIHAVVKFHRQFPDRPLQQCVPGLAGTVLRKLLPEGTYERDRLENLVASDVPCHDLTEFCSRLATFETGITPDDGQAFLNQAELVAAELSQFGCCEQSPWLDRLRATMPAVGAPSPVQADAEFGGHAIAGDEKRLIIPSHPKLGNWIGVTLFASIGLVCAWFGHSVAALVLILIGILSLISSVTFWEIDKAHGRVWLKSGNGFPGARQHMGYPASEVTGVELEVRTDSEGGRQYSVRMNFQKGQRIEVSKQPRDADCIAAFLDVKQSESNL